VQVEELLRAQAEEQPKPWARQRLGAVVSEHALELQPRHQWVRQAPDRRRDPPVAESAT
jgi:hypothetical protein